MYPIFSYNGSYRIDKLLHDIEKKHGISAMWITEDEQYLVGKEKIASNKAKRCLQNLRKHVVERWFTLSLKSKYFGMQSVLCSSRYNISLKLKLFF